MRRPRFAAKVAALHCAGGRLFSLVLMTGLAACSFFPPPAPPVPPPDSIGTVVALTVAALPTNTPGQPETGQPETGQPETVAPTDTSAPATFTPAPPPPSAPAPSDTPPPLPPVPDESILILSPGPGSQVVGPITVSGISDPAQHQQLLVELIAEDGSTVAQLPATINADLGQRGPFSVSLPFTGGPMNARIQVSISSPRDGGLTHLSSVGVQLLPPGGTANILPGQPHPETIFIAAPLASSVVSGGSVEVSGVALASFEQTLVVEIQNADGTVIARFPVTVTAPDVGQPGAFSINVPYIVTSEGPGRMVVKDESVGIPGLIHLSSVEVTLRP